MSNDIQSAGPNPVNNSQLEVHPGWVRSGQDNTPGRKAYYINLEAKPGNGDKVEQFLRDILAGVEQEPGTGPWFGTRFSDTTFGIFEAFPDAAARSAHDVGPGGQNFLRAAELEEMLAYPAHVYRFDVMFGKFSLVRKEDCWRIMPWTVAAQNSVDLLMMPRRSAELSKSAIGLCSHSEVSCHIRRYSQRPECNSQLL